MGIDKFYMNFAAQCDRSAVVNATNSTAADETIVAITNAPSTPTNQPAATSDKSGLSTGAIAGIVSSAIVVVLAVVMIMVVRKRKRKLDKSPGDVGFAYADLSDDDTDDTLNGSDLLRGGLALAAFRIPFNALKPGEVVSQGGFGEVLHGAYNGESVAIKRLLAARRKEPHSIRSFFREIQLTASLEHECIVKFIGVAWDVPANLCMVSEFMHGGDLRSLLMRYSREGHAHGHDDGKLRIAVQVAHALTYLHSLDVPVVHRDLKSRNILLTESLDAKVIDFGISCERQDVTMTAGVGTSLWMAPEVMLGKRYDEKADVFSFGVILSELDTHELPYDDVVDPVSKRKLADMVLMQLVCDGQLKPRFTEMADPDMVSLARDCIELDPAKRPRASQVLYQIHKNCRNSRSLSVETRAAINRSIITTEARSITP
jgi:serine/threonine-protein kinase TNNI3K